VYDNKDRQLASNRGYFGTDALTDFTAPQSGEYRIRVFLFTHTFRPAIAGNMPQGASDYFYRLSVSAAPWIDAIVPNVVEPGKPTTVTVYGRNLPGSKPDPKAIVEDCVLETMTMTVTAPAEAKDKLTYTGHVPPAMGWQDGFEVRVKNAIGSSNPFLVGIARVPVVLDNGTNDTPETAQEVQLPCEIAGRVEKRRDRDWYTFNAKKGDTWNIEVLSSRLGAPTYMAILMRLPATKSEFYESPLQESNNQFAMRFFSRSEDPPNYRFVVPADGKYQLLVTSRAGDTLYGPRHNYAVRISQEIQEFRLIALSSEVDVPDALNVRAGGQAAFTVLAHRPDGFTSDIELSAEGLPAGVTCTPQILNNIVRKTTLVLTATPEAASWVGEVKVKGVATINGTKVTQYARPAGIVWPIQPNQNTPTASRLEQGLWLSVRGKAPFTLTPTIDKADLVQGDKATVKVKLNRLWPEVKTPMQVGLMQSQNRQGSEVPQNLRFNNNQPVNINPGQAEATLPVTVANDVPPGVYNVVFRGQTQIPYNKDPMSKVKPNTFIVQPSLPLTVTVLPKAVAQLSLSTNSMNVKVGGQSEIVVRVQRRFNYQGEFKVQLVLPMGVTGVEAGDVTIPAGKDEAKLVVKVPAGQTPGGRNNLIVKVTAMWAGKTPTVHETKFNVNIVK
jgi:hypothetical protein